MRRTAQRNARKLRDPRSYVEKAADKHKRKCVDPDGDPAKKEAKTKADAINDPGRERTPLPSPMKANKVQRGSVPDKIKTLLPAASEPWTDIS